MVVRPSNILPSTRGLNDPAPGGNTTNFELHDKKGSMCVSSKDSIADMNNPFASPGGKGLGKAGGHSNILHHRTQYVENTASVEVSENDYQSSHHHNN